MISETAVLNQKIGQLERALVEMALLLSETRVCGRMEIEVARGREENAIRALEDRQEDLVDARSEGTAQRLEACRRTLALTVERITRVNKLLDERGVPGSGCAPSRVAEEDMPMVRVRYALDHPQPQSERTGCLDCYEGIFKRIWDLFDGDPLSAFPECDKAQGWIERMEALLDHELLAPRAPKPA